MTNKQIANLGQQVLLDLPGFIVDRDLVLKLPVGDFLQALCFERCSDPSSFHLHVFFMPLFVPDEHINLSYGKRIGNPLDWNLKNPNLFVEIRSVIRSQAIPFLNNISTLTGVLNYFRADIEKDLLRVNPHTVEALAYTLIKSGDYVAARSELTELRQRFGNSKTSWVLELVARARMAEEKLSQNPKESFGQLAAWRTETVSKLGLEKYCKQQH